VQLQEVGIVTTPDEQIGCLIQAVVVLQPGGKLTEKEVKKFCRQYLPIYMIPDRVEFLDGLPRTPTGKTDKVLLQKLNDSASQN